MLEKNEMIFGVRAVIEAIQAGREIDKVLAISFTLSSSVRSEERRVGKEC